VAGALAYFLLPAVFFLLLEPYKSDRFTRFHSLQSVGFFLAGLATAALLALAGTVLSLIPALPLLFLSLLIGLAFAITWMALAIKALQGERLKLPLVGELAATASR
jgi:uncharacterized membrane protein